MNEFVMDCEFKSSVTNKTVREIGVKTTEELKKFIETHTISKIEIKEFLGYGHVDYDKLRNNSISCFHPGKILFKSRNKQDILEWLKEGK